MDHQNKEIKAPSEPVRSRWTPKPEQIQILENIFNSGTVNPAKDETIRIRKILEQYGPVGDTNVFYWFQNRRSRSRRRQRQLQAAVAAASAAAGSVNFFGHNITGTSLYETAPCSSASSTSLGSGLLYYNHSSSSVTSLPSSSSSSQGFIRDDSYGDDLFSISGQMGYAQQDQSPYMYSLDASQSQYQSADERVHGIATVGNITVFINGIPSEIPQGPFDVRAIYGQDVMLVHSSGELPPINEYGKQTLQMGESYYLVSRPT